MGEQMTTDPARQSLIDAATHFYELGWMCGTAGNLSVRLDDGSFWVTASGKAKGKLAPGDFVRVTVEGEVLERGAPTARPSAETSIHQAVYRLYPEARACFHVHSIEANLVSLLAEGGVVTLPPLEMLKGFGLRAQPTPLPVFANHDDVPQIAADILERFGPQPPALPALLIRDHGITVWGGSAQQALNGVELIEYMFRYMVAKVRTGL